MHRYVAARMWVWLVSLLVGAHARAAVNLVSFTADPPSPASNELFISVGAQGIPASPHDIGAAKAWPVKINLAGLATLPPDVIVNLPGDAFDLRGGLSRIHEVVALVGEIERCLEPGAEVE